MRNGEVSYWWRALGGMPPRRPSLPGPAETDVCIVGGGYTGLWTAYYLKGLSPGSRVVVLEAAFAGYGASGRNGGWVTAELPGSRDRYARGPRGAGGVRDLEAALRDTVDEVGRVCAAESIAADFLRGGRLAVATTPTQLARLRAGLAHVREWGDGEDVYEFLSRDETRERINVAGALGSIYAPHSARVQPAALAAGLAAAAERRGVEIYEATPVTAIRGAAGSAAGAVAETVFGDVRARSLLRCTEGYTALLPGSPARPAADEQLHGGDRTAARFGVEGNRLGRRRDAGRRGTRLHVRAADRRRPDRARRPRGTVPVRIRRGSPGGDEPGDGRRARPDPAAHVPRRRLGAARARLVRGARRAARLVRVGQLRSRVRPRLGGRLHRARRRRGQPGRPARWPTWCSGRRPR